MADPRYGDWNGWQFVELFFAVFLLIEILVRSYAEGLQPKSEWFCFVGLANYRTLRFHKPTFYTVVSPKQLLLPSSSQHFGKEWQRHCAQQCSSSG